MNKYQEALDRIRFDILNCGDCDGDFDKNICKTKCDFKKDIDCLQELVDKETPEEPEIVDRIGQFTFYKCKACESVICKRDLEPDDNYCPDCGQKLG